MRKSKTFSASTPTQDNCRITNVVMHNSLIPRDSPRNFLALSLALFLSIFSVSVFADSHDREDTPNFIAADFEPPRFVETGSFVLKPLGPELVEVDYAAYMSSIEHLRTTFSTNGGWPHEDISMTDAMVDMQNEKRRFEARESFAYAVLTADQQVELGCVYVYPSDKKGFDAVIRLWVTKSQFDEGFDATLYDWTTRWIERAWGFSAAAFPGREIPWDVWNALENQS